MATYEIDGSYTGQFRTLELEHEDQIHVERSANTDRDDQEHVDAREWSDIVAAARRGGCLVEYDVDESFLYECDVYVALSNDDADDDDWE